jgi:hypothetical protein
MNNNLGLVTVGVAVVVVATAVMAAAAAITTASFQQQIAAACWKCDPFFRNNAPMATSGDNNIYVT